jgi:hypothetical protein
MPVAGSTKVRVDCSEIFFDAMLKVAIIFVP